MKLLKVGVVGMGVGAAHARVYSEHPNCTPGLLCDFDAGKLESMAAEFGDWQMCSDAEDVLADPSIDLVSIASFDNYHADQIVMAIEHGKHVYVEKPMCLTRDEAARISVALRAHPEARLSSNLVLRTCPRFKKVRESLQAGDMGRIYHWEGDYYWGRKQKLTHGWRKDMPFYSIIHGAAVHMVDLLLWMTERRPVTVQAFGNGLSTNDSEMNFNDFSMLSMQFDDGMVAKVSAHGGCVHPHFHRLAVFGTEKTFFNELPDGKWFDSCDPAIPFAFDAEAYPGKEVRGGLLAAFVDSILGSPSSDCVSERDVFDCMSVCFAAEESVEQGRPVEIEYFDLR
ncbi:MAG: Gfo/Idh/MocA family oxidoreductase [Pseudodesulfovibrio sp.]